MTDSSAPPAEPPIPVERYEAAGATSADRHAAWAERPWPSVAALFRSEPIGAFATTATQVEFDGLVVQYAEGTARRFDRPAARIRADGIDVLGVGVQLDGVMHGTARAAAFHAAAGALLLLDAAQPASVLLEGGRSLQLILPRAVAEEQLGHVRQLHGTVVAPARAALLLGHLLRLREALPLLTVAQRPRLARTVTDLLALALDDPATVRTPAAAASSAPPAAALASAKGEIEARLGVPSLGVAWLCQRLHISRSALFRLFEADGGVEAFIRRRRLEQVHAALLDPANTDRVGQLAERWGFGDASHLTRLFRRHYGVTPGALRTGARQAGTLVPAG